MSLKYTMAVVSALAMLSTVGVAHAEMSKRVVTKIGPHGYSRTVTRQHMDRYGNLVQRKRTIHEGFSGSSVNRSRTVTTPDGGSITKSITTDR